MGSLWNFDLSDEFVRQFPVFVETGYGDGHGVECASQFAFQKIYSIEIYSEAAKRGIERFSHDPRVQIVKSASVDGLRAIMRHQDDGIFFWLDAHFPGSDYHGVSFDTYAMPIRLPLEEELATIVALGKRYTILADDLNYYGTLPFQQSHRPEWRAVRPLAFLARFTPTHSVQILLNDKGYALISPLGAPVPRMISTEPFDLDEFLAFYKNT